MLKTRIARIGCVAWQNQQAFSKPCLVAVSKDTHPVFFIYMYSKTCVKRLPSTRQKIGFEDQISLYAGQKYCRMLQSILQYFRPALSYHLSLTSLFCLFLSDPFTHVLLYNPI